MPATPWCPCRAPLPRERGAGAGHDEAGAPGCGAPQRCRRRPREQEARRPAEADRGPGVDHDEAASATSPSAFAARAAAATLLGLVALAGFVVVYAWSAVRLGWAMSLLLAWAAAAALGLVVGQVRPGLAVAGIGAALAIAVARGGLPDTGTVAVHGRRRRGTCRCGCC